MFGIKWDKFWSDFGSLMDQMPGVITEATEAGINGPYRTVKIVNGHVKMRGSFKSLEINGKTIKIPKEVMEG